VLPALPPRGDAVCLCSTRTHVLRPSRRRADQLRKATERAGAILAPQAKAVGKVVTIRR
jgi:hypothetical protein